MKLIFIIIDLTKINYTYNQLMNSPALVDKRFLSEFRKPIIHLLSPGSEHLVVHQLKMDKKCIEKLQMIFGICIIIIWEV